MKHLRRWAPPVLLLALFGLGLLRAGELLRAQRIVRAVEGRTLAMIRAGRLSRGILVEHVAQLEKARRLDPAEVAIRVALGSEHLLLGDSARARAAYEDALALEPRPEIHLNLGKAWLAAGNEAEARRAFDRALLFDPLLKQEVPQAYRR